MSFKGRQAPPECCYRPSFAVSCEEVEMNARASAW